MWASRQGRGDWRDVQSRFLGGNSGRGSWEKIPLQCDEGYRATSLRGRQDGAVLKAWAPMNPASATYQLCKAVAISSLSFLLCIGRNHDAPFIWLKGSIYVACLMQCLNPSRLCKFWQLKKRKKNLKHLWDWRF